MAFCQSFSMRTEAAQGAGEQVLFEPARSQMPTVTVVDGRKAFVASSLSSLRNPLTL